ncbi:MAG: hypothetical protein IJB10_05645, partial [Clostridia bacterium]|nr:hypothetical protein [Clostridia bacterium]
MKKRRDIAKEYKWDFSDYFVSDKQWESTFEEYCNKMQKIKEYNGKLTNKTDILTCFKLLEELDLYAEPLYIYAHCLHDVDVAATKYQEFLNKIENKLTEQSVLSSYITPQLSSL